MSATTLKKTRTHFNNIFARLALITESEVERSTPLGSETKKEDFIRYYNNIHADYRR